MGQALFNAWDGNFQAQNRPLGGILGIFPSDAGIPSLDVAGRAAHQAMQGGLL